MIYKEEAYEIIGACMEVHRHLGCGFLEGVYQDALAIEFSDRNIPFEQEKSIEISYKSAPINHIFIADFVVFDKIIVELKAVNELNNVHSAQVINYLKATGKKLGVLVNFGQESLEYRRFVY